MKRYTRYNILLQGPTTCNWCAGFIREDVNLETLVWVAPGEPVALYNLVFNGNGTGNGYFPGGSYSTPAPNAPWQYLDLDVSNSPSANIQDCSFANSPSYSIDAQNYSFIYSNQFQYVGYTAVIAWSRSGGANVEVENSGFSYIGGNAIVFDGIANGMIYGNTVFNHVGYICFNNSGGGAIDVAVASTNDSVNNNYVDGQDTSCSYPSANNGANQGLEMYGSGHQVNNNTFTNNTAEGVRLASFSNITLYNNQITNNGNGYSSSGLYYAGVGLLGQANGDPGCSPSAETVSLQNNTIEQNYGWGVLALQDGCNGPNSQTVTLSGNTIQGNRYGATSYQ